LTATITIPVPLKLLKLRVYNSAGELVRVINSGLNSQDLPVGLRGVKTIFVPDAGEKGLFDIVGTKYSFEWDGLSDSGQLVNQGTYTASLEWDDPFLNSTVITGTMTVLRNPAGVSIDIFNSAGEIVRSLHSGAAGVGGGLVVHATAQADGLLSYKITFGDRPDQTIVWDSKNSTGQPVDQGSYMVVVRQLDGAAHNLVAPIQVVRNKNNRPDVIVAPNPYGPGNPGPMRIDTAGFEIEDLQAYNMAGELVWRGGPGASPRFWDLYNSNLASGIYVLSLKLKGPAGEIFHVTRRFALVR
jgi:flagellar hook assembly protein FlgD